MGDTGGQRAQARLLRTPSPNLGRKDEICRNTDYSETRLGKNPSALAMGRDCGISFAGSL